MTKELPKNYSATSELQKSKLENLPQDPINVILNDLTNKDHAEVSESSKTLYQRVQNYRSTVNHARIASAQTTDQLHALLRKYGSNLSFLDLSDNRFVTNETLEVIYEIAPNLQSINLDCCHNLTDAGVQSLVKFQQLKILNLSHFRDLNEATFIQLSQLTKLQVLELGFSSITDRSLQNLILANPDLEVLNIRSSHITDAAFQDLPNLTKLCVLNISNCNQISNNTLHKLIQANPDLEVLDISTCNHITGAAFEDLKLTKLRVLNISGCNQINDAILHKLIEANPDLEVLDLSRCDQLTDAAFNNLPNLTRLKTINFSSCYLISDKVIDGLIASNTNLRSIDINGCSRLTDAAFQNLNKLENLNVLSLDFCSITGVTLTGLGTTFGKNLERLNLAGCRGINDEALQTLQLTNLKTLGLSGNRNITDKGVKSILESNQKLEEVNLFGSEISNDTLHILANLPNLRIVGFACTGVDERYQEISSKKDLIKAGFGREEKKEEETKSSSPSSKTQPSLTNSLSSSSQSRG